VNRRELGYPPFSHLALIALDDPEEGRLQLEATRLAEVARAFTPAVEVLGPTPAPLARWKGRYRWRFLLRAKDRGKLREALVAVHRASALAHHDTRVALDIDPSHLL
jgi:primosomal protein N' (replication factor Y)